MAGSFSSTLRDALERGRARPTELLAGDIEELEEKARKRAWPAAVLVPIVERARPTVILTLRPENMRRHAGQVSFPGGRIEPGDAGPVAAALREAEEEIGLDRDRVDVIGTVDPYRTITGFEVTPVVGIVPPGLDLDPDPREVAAWFEVPLDHLLDPGRQRIRTAHYRGRDRTFYEIDHDGQRIWGATAAMIVNLGRRLRSVEAAL